MGILNVQSVGSGTGAKHPEAAAAMLSPLMHLLAGEIGNKMEQRRADQMSPETAKNMNQLLGIPETVKTPGQAEGPTEPGAEAPTGIANTPNPEAFTASSMKGFTRPQQATLTSQVIEKKLSPTLTAQNNKLLADKAYGELLSNDNLKGYQRSGLEKILSGDPGSFKDYEKQTNNQATGYSIPEYNRTKTIPGQEENAADLKSYILSMNPDYGKFQQTTPILKDGKTYIGMRDSFGDTVETDKQTVNPLDVADKKMEGMGENRLYPVDTGNGSVYKSAKEITTGNKAGNPSKAAAYSPEVKQSLAEAQQRGGSQSANVNAANDLYQQNLPLVIDLRNKVAMKGLLPDTSFKTWNAVKQWAMEQTSDPDLNELKGKIMLMSDNLQKTIGGSQGGEWSYKVASTLLNGSLSTEAFERRMNSHGADLATLAKSRRHFGENEVATQPAANQVTTRSGNKFTIVGR